MPSPSLGLGLGLRCAALRTRPRPQPHRLLLSRCRWCNSTSTGTHPGILAGAGLPEHRVQVYASASPDPFFNLAVEHRLLQASHPESTVLFLYRNDPCVVIGRNQNPWVEVGLAALRRGFPSGRGEKVRLVRRRSGGGAVFHDRGNVNYSVICPAAVFDRDRHAEMVVRALRGGMGVGSEGDVRVNCRHDIVMDGPDEAGTGAETSNAKACEAAGNATANKKTYKISGSAYKLTRLRALHHGTCLLRSPHLSAISALLRSPAAPYIRARGVESVRSPVRNVFASPSSSSEDSREEGALAQVFVAAVRAEFERLHGAASLVRILAGDELSLSSPSTSTPADPDLEEIRKGYDELRSRDWVFGQTPQFTFSTRASEADPRARPAPPAGVPPEFNLSFTARHGRLQDVHVSGVPYAEDVDATSQDRLLAGALEGLLLYEVQDWRETLGRAAASGGSGVPLSTSNSSSTASASAIGAWLNGLFGLATR